MPFVYLVKPVTVESHEEEKKGSYPPLGLLYLSSMFKEYGFETKLYDLDFVDENALVKQASHEQPEIVAITSTTPSYYSIVHVIKRLREILKNSLFAVGGPHATLVPEDFIGIADVIVKGEGERVISELVKMSRKQRFKNTIVLNGETVENLDEIPYPDRSILDRRYYSENLGSMFTSRGCPYNCLFCATRFIMGRKFRARSVGNVIGEWIELKEKYKAPKIRILDDVFTFNRQRAVEICKQVKEYGLGEWSLPNGVRVDNVDAELLELMADSGCTTVWYGVESGSQKVINILRKGIKLEQVEKVVECSKDVGLSIGLFFMVGAPGETLETIYETLKLIEKLDPDYVHFSIATPYPGTDFWKWVEENGRFLTHDYSKFEREFIFETPDYPLKDRIKAIEIIEKELSLKYEVEF